MTAGWWSAPVAAQGVSDWLESGQDCADRLVRHSGAGDDDVIGAGGHNSCLLSGSGEREFLAATRCRAILDAWAEMRGIRWPMRRPSNLDVERALRITVSDREGACPPVPEPYRVADQLVCLIPLQRRYRHVGVDNDARLTPRCDHTFKDSGELRRCLAERLAQPERPPHRLRGDRSYLAHDPHLVASRQLKQVSSTGHRQSARTYLRSPGQVMAVDKRPRSRHTNIPGKTRDNPRRAFIASQLRPIPGKALTRSTLTVKHRHRMRARAIDQTLPPIRPRLLIQPDATKPTAHPTPTQDLHTHQLHSVRHDTEV